MPSLSFSRDQNCIAPLQKILRVCLSGLRLVQTHPKDFCYYGPMSKPIPLEYGRCYHIYNRGTNRENVFIEKRNYRHFLRLYAQYIVPVADTHAYCLLRNHFHLLARIKTPEELAQSQNLGQAFSDLFNAYAKAINSAYQRTGSLFQHPFGRIVVDSDRYFQKLVVYIHQNPQRHGLIDDFRRWEFSSYGSFLSDQHSHLRRTEVVTWFDNMDNFRAMHDMPIREQTIVALIADDFD